MVDATLVPDPGEIVKQLARELRELGHHHARNGAWGQASRDQRLRELAGMGVRHP